MGGNYARSSPAIGADGTIYVGSDAGVLYALKGSTNRGLAHSSWPKFLGNRQNTGRVRDAGLGDDYRIWRLTGAWQVTTPAGSGTAGFAEGSGANAQFNAPQGCWVAVDGTVYVADTGNHRIRVVNASGAVTTLAGNGIAGHRDGAATEAQFAGPVGICRDAQGNFFITETNHYIRQLSLDGHVSTVAGTGVAGYQDGPAANAQFNAPRGVAVDGGGNLWVADFNNHAVRQISPTGIVSTWVGNGTAGSQDGPRAGARLNQPAGIALGPSGSLYVSEWGGQRIRLITAAGQVTTLAGSGVPGCLDGDGTSAAFNHPDGLIWDATGALLVVDSGNSMVRRVNPDGRTQTVAGMPVAGFADGDARHARFARPAGIGLDAAGALFVVDAGNAAVRRIAMAEAAPVLVAIPNQTVDVFKPFTLTLQTTTSNLQYRFELLGGAPAGMSLDAATGVLTWTPIGMQGRTTNVVGVRVVDAVGSADTRTFTVAVTWPAKAPGGQQWKFTAGGAILGCPAIDDQGTVYFGAEDKKVYAVNGVTGEKKWEFETGGAVRAAPAVGVNGLVYVGSDDGQLYALETGNGHLRWAFPTAQPVRSAPAIGPDGTVYLAGDANKVYALKGDVGLRLWEFDLRGQVASSPAMGADGTLYVVEALSVYYSTMGVALYAVNGRDGAQIWKTTLWTNSSGAGCSGPAIGTNGLVYVGAPFGFYALEQKTGVVKYTAGPPADEGIPPDGNFTSAIWSHYYEVWNWEGLRQWCLSPVIGVNNTLYCGMHTKTLWATDAATGTEQWAAPLGDYLASAPAVGSDGTVYAGTMGGVLWALDGSSGAKQWQFPIGSTPSAVTLSSAGTLYIGSASGKLYAITANAPGGLADSPWPKYQGNGRNTGSVLPEILNRAPVLTMPPTQVIDEQTPLTLTLVATDPDVPTNTLTYGLISAPQGVNLDAATGVLAWTPTELQGPGTYLISVWVADNGMPPLSATNSVTVVVNEVNRAPVLTTAVRDFRVAAGATLVFTNTATDADIPANTLVFLLDLDAPAGARLERNTGVFVWTAPNSAAINRFHIWVTDDGAQYLRDSQLFTIVTVAAPRPIRFQSTRRNPNGGIELVWGGGSGTAFSLQYKTRLDDSRWLDVEGAPTTNAESVTFTIPVSSDAQRFYRVLQKGD